MAPLNILPPGTNLRFVFMVVNLFVCYLCMTEVSAGGIGRELLGKRLTEKREFDLFKLSLQWPGTYCQRTRRCCSSNGCCQSSNNLPGFTIHGLWPDYNDGSWPSCCNGKRFDVNEISALRKGLNKYWPSLSCSSSTNCHGGKGIFWEHEWEKHGTCASSVTGDEYNYFVTAINLYLKYNVTEVLKEAGYVASNYEKYPLGGIVEAMQNAFHATPEIQCSKGAVQELHLCFYKDFKPRDCEAASGNSCPAYVSLPEFVLPEMVNADAQDSNSAFNYRSFI